jgi:hypothetical protein
MKGLEFDEVHLDPFGNVIGIIQGAEPGPTLLLRVRLCFLTPIPTRLMSPAASLGRGILSAERWRTVICTVGEVLT